MNIDGFITAVDTALRTLLPPARRASRRPSPAQELIDPPFSLSEKKHTAGLMRVNHAGEVCAQALYQGQALTARLPHVQAQMAEAAAEETDHLAWCETRLTELGSRPSVLNPVWYMGSLILGALAGFAGDKISLGFVAETERQVTAHLQGHLERVPIEDKKTKAILKRMHEDEAHHATLALNSGATELPQFVKQLMNITSKVMTISSYHI
jgi:ubiquinone biosynthesis monooxygenase Coq7